MTKNILVLFLIVTGFNLKAQEYSFSFIEKVNAQLLAIEKGTYSITYKIKSFFDVDTSKGGGSVQYFKTQGGPGDSIARFVFGPIDQVTQGFDGTLFWAINNEQKQVILYDPAQKKGILDYISHYNSTRSHILSAPILTNKGHRPLNPSDFQDWKFGYFELNDTLFVALSKNSYELNKQKLTPNDSDSIQIKEQWLFYPNEHMPRRKRLTVDKGNGLVYFDEINYSQIRNLPDSLDWRVALNMPTLLQQGYQFLEKTILQVKSSQPVVVGDTVIDFMVRLETGDTLPLFSAFKQRYLVLDFWYRACAPCNMAMPGLDRTAKALIGKNIAIVGINPIDKQFDKLLGQYKKQFNYHFYITFTDKKVAEQLKIRAYPTIIVVDTHTRRIIRLTEGYLEQEEQELRNYLEGLLH